MGCSIGSSESGSAKEIDAAQRLCCMPSVVKQTSFAVHSKDSAKVRDFKHRSFGRNIIDGIKSGLAATALKLAFPEGGNNW
jgi:hypothetical protein